MDRYFKISEIKRALKEIEQNQSHKKYISIGELTGNLKEVNKALVYNHDEIITDLSAYLKKSVNSARNELYTETEISKILKVNRTTLYYWQTNEYIRYAKLNNSMIRYKLTDLLQDLQALQAQFNNMASKSFNDRLWPFQAKFHEAIRGRKWP